MASLLLHKQRYWKNDGSLNAGGKVYVYESGTSTPKTTYTTAAATVAHAHPIVLDSKGEANIFTTGTFEVNVTDSDGVQITGFPVDGLGDVLGSSIHSATAKTTPVDADEVSIWDSVTQVAQKVTWANVKATLLTTWKDATGGLVGMTLFKINFKNAANTFTSFFTNTNTAARTYTFQDRNGTIADDTDLAAKAALAGSAAVAFNVGTPTADEHAMNLAQFAAGWISEIGTWTCTTAGVAGSLNANGSINVTPVSAVFTIPGDHTATYVKGVKLKWTQITVKYGYVLSSSYGAGVTTVTIAPNADYLMVLSGTTAITSPYFSFGRPSGFPAFINYIGAIVPGAGALTNVSVMQKYRMDGSVITLCGRVAITDVGTATTAMFMALPITAVSANYAGSGRENATLGIALTVGLSSTTQVSFGQKYDNTASMTNGYGNTFTIIYE